MTQLVSLLVLNLLVLNLLPLIYGGSHYQLEVFVYNYEVPQGICDNQLKFQNISIVNDAISSNISSGISEPLDETCWNFYQIGFDRNLNRMNPIAINYSSTDEAYLFTEIMFVNESSEEVYSIAIDLMTLEANSNYSPRQRYIHESNMFALHLSYKITCAMSFTGDNCDTPVMEPFCEQMSPSLMMSKNELVSTSFAEVLLSSSQEVNPSLHTYEIILPSDEVILSPSLEMNPSLIEDEISLVSDKVILSPSLDVNFSLYTDEAFLPSEKMTLSPSLDTQQSLFTNEVFLPSDKVTLSPSLDMKQSLFTNEVFLPSDEVTLSPSLDVDQSRLTNKVFLPSDIVILSTSSKMNLPLSSRMISPTLDDMAAPTVTDKVSSQSQSHEVTLPTLTHDLTSTSYIEKHISQSSDPDISNTYLTVIQSSIVLNTATSSSLSSLTAGNFDELMCTCQIQSQKSNEIISRSTSVATSQLSVAVTRISSVSDQSKLTILDPEKNLSPLISLTPTSVFMDQIKTSSVTSESQLIQLESMVSSIPSANQKNLSAAMLLSLYNSATLLVQPSSSFTLSQGEKSQSLLTPMAVYLIASLGALVGLLIIIIFAMAVAICCMKKYASKKDFIPKEYNKYFVNPNETMTDNADSLPGNPRPRSQTHLTLINGQVFFWKKSKKEIRHNDLKAGKEEIQLTGVADDPANQMRNTKSKNCIYEYSYAMETSSMIPAYVHAANEEEVFSADVVDEVEAVTDSSKPSEIAIKKFEVGVDISPQSNAESEISASVGGDKQIKKKMEEECDIFKEERRAIKAEGDVGKDTQNQVYLDIISLPPVKVNKVERSNEDSKIAQSSSTTTTSATKEDNSKISDTCGDTAEERNHSSDKTNWVKGKRMRSKADDCFVVSNMSADQDGRQLADGKSFSDSHGVPAKEEGAAVQKKGAIFEHNPNFSDLSPCSTESTSTVITARQDDKKSSKLSRTGKISSFRSPGSFRKSAEGEKLMNLSTQGSDLSIQEFPKSTSKRTKAHTKIMKKASSDLRDELQRKVKDNTAPKDPRNIQERSWSHGKQKSSSTRGNFPLSPTAWGSESFKETSSTQRTVKMDFKKALLSKKISAPDPSEMAKCKESVTKKPMVPPVSKITSDDFNSQNVYDLVIVKPKPKPGENVVVGGDGYVDPKDIVGRRGGSADSEDSSGYGYVPVDAPLSHSGDASINLMQNLAYATPHVTTTNSPKSSTNMDNSNNLYECV